MKWFFHLLTAIHLLIVGLLLLNFLNAWIPPSSFSKLNFLSLAFPGLMVANLFLLLIWLISFKKRFIFFALLSALLFYPTQRWFNYHSPKKTDGKKTLKVLSFNCKLTSDERRAAIEKYLNSGDFDIINLQEASVIKPKSKLPYSYTEELLMATYSRYKIVGTKPLITSDEDRQSYAIQTDVEIEGKVVRVINIHLSSFLFNKDMVRPELESELNKQKLKEIYRTLQPGFRKHEDQLKIITKAIRNSPHPVIVTGDLNAVPNSYEYYEISRGLHNAFVKAGKGFSTSFHDYKIPITIDYIFTSKEFSALDYKVDRTVTISDHFPVSSTLELNF